MVLPEVLLGVLLGLFEAFPSPEGGTDGGVDIEGGSGVEAGGVVREGAFAALPGLGGAGGRSV